LETYWTQYIHELSNYESKKQKQAIEEDKDGNFIVRNVANDLFSLLRDLGRSTTGYWL
jgi:hypothetical protein